jgi:hypothetical protein
MSRSDEQQATARSASIVAPKITDSTSDDQLTFANVGEVESMTEDVSMKNALLKSGLVSEDPSEEAAGRLWITESPDQFGLPLFISTSGLPHGRIDLFECRAPYAANIRVASRWLEEPEQEAPGALQQMLLEYARRLSLDSD